MLSRQVSFPSDIIVHQFHSPVSVPASRVVADIKTSVVEQDVTRAVQRASDERRLLYGPVPWKHSEYRVTSEPTMEHGIRRRLHYGPVPLETLTANARTRHAKIHTNMYEEMYHVKGNIQKHRTPAYSLGNWQSEHMLSYSMQFPQHLINQILSPITCRRMLSGFEQWLKPGELMAKAT